MWVRTGMWFRVVILNFVTIACVLYFFKAVHFKRDKI